MPRKPIIVNDQQFTSKKSLREYIRAIRDRYEDFVPLSSDDFQFMLALLDRHQNADIKIGCGVANMYVKTTPPYYTRAFWLRRIDGTETDFSFEMCLRAETHSQKVKAALRFIVAQDIIRFKDNFFAQSGRVVTCPITSEKMTYYDNCHIDHAPPNTFQKIVEDFLTTEGLSLDEIELIPGGDGKTVDTIVDNLLIARFITFHNERATLRAVSKRANLSVVKQDPATHSVPTQPRLFD